MRNREIVGKLRIIVPTESKIRPFTLRRIDFLGLLVITGHVGLILALRIGIVCFDF